MWRVIAKHEAIGRSQTRHTIVEMGEGADRDFILQDGRALTRQQDGTFLIAENGEILRLSFPIV
ncbi:hypothetical protein WG901_22975 [Novosphingobium sp. PS1R-30]|uniref:Quercetin 2,3-dioxygenase C-terminal cupin domain-containing protein n=1 Tax=Novosphingobium anseongense TaxID=3133436 RepID=A0ABU8S3I4_9SPHN